MLQDKDRIFTNLYGLHDFRLAGARQRGDCDNTNKFASSLLYLKFTSTFIHSFFPTLRDRTPKASYLEIFLIQ